MASISVSSPDHNNRRTRVDRPYGYTLIEIILAIAAIGIIAGLSFPIYRSMQAKNDLDIAAISLVQSLRRAQVLAQSVDGDASWGINIQSGSITLFQGSDYAGRQTGFDEIIDVPTIITPSGLLEIVYDKFTGEPQAIGTVTLTSTANEIRTITINEKGTLQY